MAAGRTSRPESGLCVVINGNLKQRELTISFFISSPMLRAQEAPMNARSPGAANTLTLVQTHVRANTRSTGGGGGGGRVCRSHLVEG